METKTTTTIELKELINAILDKNIELLNSIADSYKNGNELIIDNTSIFVSIDRVSIKNYETTTFPSHQTYEPPSRWLQPSYPSWRNPFYTDPLNPWKITSSNIEQDHSVTLYALNETESLDNQKIDGIYKSYFRVSDDFDFSNVERLKSTTINCLQI